MGDLSMINTGWVSILPPLIAIVLALISKEVYSSLVVGILSGMLIYSFSGGGNFVDAIANVPRMMAQQLGNNGGMILFLALLGALVAVVTIAGGSRAYGSWARKKIKSVHGAKLLTCLLGIVIFIDDYFNCLTVGTVMRPVTDKFGISRAKLAYLIDATAAPICIIAPISSWAVAVAGNIGLENSFSLFVQSIPYNLYALLTIGMVLVVCLTNFDFGPMKKAEEEAKRQLEESADDEEVDFDGIKPSKNGRVLDLVIPILVLIVCSILGMAYVGGFFSGGIGFSEAIGEDPIIGLSIGAFCALLVAALLYIPRKTISFRGFMEGVAKGVKSMVPAIMILTLAWSLSGICRDMIGTGPFVADLVSKMAESAGNVVFRLLPAVVFALAAFLSFSMGTAWGTFGILLPIVIPICTAVPAGMTVLLPTIGATLAGSVYGDHCSPISDTTILSSTGAKCNHLQHVSTQIPYTTFVAVICFVGYLVAGLCGNVWLPLLVSFVLLFGAMFLVSRLQKKGVKAAG
ncbi:MAG: Na+/H+ antiporter NhaC family protein [Firmicutes bacterium]|nr:Na+/H+ antiporter NhaC family protein [Bacillota bacterium]